MKIKFKFILGLSVILVTLGLVLNILIRQVLVTNMESRANESLKEIMNSTHEYIKYRLAATSSTLNQEAFNKEANYVVKHISLNYGCGSEISDMKGKFIAGSENIGFENIIKKGTESGVKGQAVVNLKYGDQTMNGILSYPVYIDDSYLGIVSLNKNYNDLYSNYRKIVGFITVIEVVIFFFIFALAFFMTGKITKPIVVLTKAVKQVGEGDYDSFVKIKGKDEVAVLSKEFINMKNKIKDQIQTIRNEKEKVEKLEQGRRNFFNSVTHELKTPLTAISGYAEMMIEEIVKDEEFNKRAVERIYSESERLHKLVLDLIDVSKGISFVDEEKTEVDMYRLLNQICDDMSIKAKKYSYKISKDIKKGSVFGRAGKIKELIINVIDNAIKYSTNGEEIIVRSEIDDGYYLMEVINHGEKIPDNIYNSLFEPFVKSDKSVEEHSRGLGLYICSEIIKEHDGEITIENGEIIKMKIKIPSFGNNLATS